MTPSRHRRRPRVALRKESVDRNPEQTRVYSSVASSVALRKESVDRNANFDGFYWWVEVALRKESVDRNLVAVGSLTTLGGRSPQGERG